MQAKITESLVTDSPELRFSGGDITSRKGFPRTSSLSERKVNERENL